MVIVCIWNKTDISLCLACSFLEKLRYIRIYIISIDSFPKSQFKISPLCRCLSRRCIASQTSGHFFSIRKPLFFPCLQCITSPTVSFRSVATLTSEVHTACSRSEWPRLAIDLCCVQMFSVHVHWLYSESMMRPEVDCLIKMFSCACSILWQWIIDFMRVQLQINTTWIIWLLVKCQVCVFKTIHWLHANAGSDLNRPLISILWSVKIAERFLRVCKL